MAHSDSRFSSSQAKADAFNSYFASVFRPNTPSTSATDLPPVNSTDAVGLESITISVEDVCCLLSGLCTTKATGPDGISATLLRECATELAPSLTELFAMSLAHGKVPSEWKRANVVPVPKNDDPSEINNYRPISLLCIISKVLEHIVHRQVYEFIKPSLHDLQHGFRPNRSCITQLLEVLQDIGKNLDSGKTTDVVYLDFPKAFDSVSHPNLIQKLRDHGISGPLLNWFCDYLSSRKQRVVIDCVSSSLLEVTSGVPQGSVVGPLLFIIYVNEIPNETTHSKTPMFADDSKCYRQITSTDDEQLLQRDIKSLQEWSVKWELSFNVQKCSMMRFTRKKNVMPAEYHLANEEIKCVNIQKDLGIFISDDLKWSNQIAHVVAKANRMLGFLRRHCTQLTNIHCRRLLYLTVRSHLSYGSEIWSPQGSSRDLVLIEGIQRRATKKVHLKFYKTQKFVFNLVHCWQLVNLK